MGAAIVAAFAFKAVSDTYTGIKEASAIKKQGKRLSLETIEDSKTIAASSKTDFLSSGIDVGGTPSNVVRGILEQGRSDASFIKKNARRSARNSYLKALGGVFSAGLSAYSQGQAKKYQDLATSRFETQNNQFRQDIDNLRKR